MFTKLWYNRAKKGGGRMKLTKCDKGIYLSNIPKAFIGAILAIVYPVFWAFTAHDLLLNNFADVDWFDVLALVILLPVYICWLIKDFVRYKITIDENGIKEYRLLAKNKELLWDEIEEYICEVTPAPYRASENFFKITFYSKTNKPSIQTWSFPNSQKQNLQSEIFSTCDKYFGN